MIAKAGAAPAPAPQQQATHGLRRFASRREQAPAPTPAPAASRMEIDPAIMQRAEGLGLQVAHDDGVWTIRSAASAGQGGGTRPASQGGGVRIQQDNPRR